MMKVKYYAFILISLNLLLGCGSKEVVPFKNGDYFEYRRINKDYGNLYRIEKGEDEMFKITWQTRASEPDEFIVDQTGKIIETPSYPKGSLAYDLFFGRQIILWLPTGKRKIGEQIYFCDFLGINVVLEEKKWKKWNVWVTKHSNVFGWQENYFDKGTGFLVGSKSEGGDVSVLHDSNVEMIK